MVMSCLPLDFQRTEKLLVILSQCPALASTFLPVVLAGGRGQSCQGSQQAQSQMVSHFPLLSRGEFHLLQVQSKDKKRRSFRGFYTAGQKRKLPSPEACKSGCA